MEKSIESQTSQIDKITLKLSQSSNFKESIKTLIKQTVNDELFWRDFINNLNLDSKINNQLNAKVPVLVKDETIKIVKRKVEIYLKDHSRELSSQVEMLVSKELNKQVTSYLNNHSQMKQILEHHSNKMTGELQTIAKDTLERIVNEDEYHEITNAHLIGVDKRCNDCIKKHDENIKSQLNSNEEKFKQQITNSENHYKGKIKDLEYRLSAFDSSNSKIKNLMEKTDKQKNKIENLEWALGIVTVLFSITTFTGFYLMTKRK